jgi:hydroxymethylpyrimidine/phosphomethylpyrimidine kinase
LQADLATFRAHGVYGCCALTASTAQNTVAVRSVVPQAPAHLLAQIDAVTSDMTVSAIKVGMLASRDNVVAVAQRLEALSVPLVVDPVLAAGTGASLLDDDGLVALRDSLLPMATLVTPNLPEARSLLALGADDLTPASELAQRLAARLGVPVLLTGGHEPGPHVVDRLIVDGTLHEIEHPRLSGAAHGTGCCLSAAITARLAKGEELRFACEGAVRFVRDAMTHRVRLGQGPGPVDPLWSH